MTRSFTSTPTDDVLAEVYDERSAQHAKWGEQNHRDGTSEALRGSADLYRWIADQRAQSGELAWRHILEEEVYEAFAETDPLGLREELIQVAAVAVAWVEAIDRRLAEEFSLDPVKPVCGMCQPRSPGASHDLCDAHADAEAATWD